MRQRSKRPSTLRTRLTLFFSGAVLVTLLLFAATVVVVLVLDDWQERREEAETQVQEPHEAPMEDVWPVLGAMAIAGPLALAGAVAVGRALAHQALSPMREATRRARAAHASTLDLTLPVQGTGDEWDELAATLNLLLTQTREALARTQRFTADAAHELRTPLTVLIGEAEVTLRHERTAQDYARTLGRVHAEGRHLAALVDSLLTLARADSGQLLADRVPLDLRALAEQGAARARQHAALQRPDVQVRVQGEPTEVAADPLLLGRLLENLLANAVRHCRSQVVVETGLEGAHARLAVQDDGAGVPESFQPRLFERFARADPSRTGEGTGLGLAISRAFAEVHGGSLHYEAAPGGGGRFVLLLPRPAALS
ncbi:HAMP domain-containing histidine kinase [Aggregicoccus sp. 17bor-14]|uniref:sensor histidine kinase n=1 Tax=Myxococcaceae TaxID=31 RepID=UPI00129C65C3|nr:MULTISPECIES: HAMP domain-containing sensor histidine kinase [Myxococcaceae]MBF5045935.1 HAMP domain-containing histidine kinase [Simulacricoccus sp. 17bor-14]MRI91667.1 HAMP domain-containing histidine kinase [Aggregicoccus sp. 17bor-14]